MAKYRAEFHRNSRFSSWEHGGTRHPVRRLFRLFPKPRSNHGYRRKQERLADILNEEETSKWQDFILSVHPLYGAPWGATVRVLTPAKDVKAGKGFSFQRAFYRRSQAFVEARLLDS